MPAAGIISTGNTYRMFDSSVQTHSTLPVGTYSVQFSPLSGFSLQKTEDLIIGEDKIYGDHGKKIERIIRAYGVTDRSLGVLFTGDKGMGKSLSMRMLAQHATDVLGLPVIKVDSNAPGIAEYLDELGEAVVVFDEFEKTFPIRGEDGNAQDQFLGLFDGVSTTKRMYVISANKVDDLSGYLVNRPGRFHYHVRHDYPAPNEVREYLRDQVPGIDDLEVEEIVTFTRKTQINFDHLRAIAFELRLGGAFRDVVGDINIKRMDTPYYKVFYKFPEQKTQTRVAHLDLFDTEGISLGITGPKNTDVDVQFVPTAVSVVGESLTVDLNQAVTRVSPYEFDADKKNEDPAYKPTSIVLEVLGQNSYTY